MEDDPVTSEALLALMVELLRSRMIDGERIHDWLTLRGETGAAHLVASAIIEASAPDPAPPSNRPRLKVV